MTYQFEGQAGSTYQIGAATLVEQSVSLAPPDVPSGFALPTMTGTQYVGDAVTVDPGDVTSITAYRVFMDAVQVGTSSTFTVPDPGMMGDRDVHTYHVEIDGTVNGVVTTVRTPKKVIYKMHMGHVYGDDNAATTAAKMAEHIGGDKSHMGLVPHELMDNVFNTSGNWSDPANWSAGRLPVTGERVLVPHGVNMTFDATDTPVLHSLRIDGSFAVDTASDRRLRAFTVACLRGCSVDVVVPDGVEFVVELATGAIDLAEDPKLLGHGWVAVGDVSVIGAEYEPYALTRAENGGLPVKGDTRVKLDAIPAGWEVGKTIRIAGSAYVVKEDGETYQTFEDRVISGFDGTDVLFTQPLEQDHDEHWDDDFHGVTRPMSDNTWRRLPVAYMYRNVRIESDDANAPIHHRPHAMHMHNYGEPRYVFVEFGELGRTNKQAFAGRILGDDTFQTYQLTANNKAEMIAPVTATPDSNRIARYGFHFHRVRVENAGVRIHAVAAGLLVRGSPGWGLSDHDSYSAIAKCVATEFAGAGFVAEQGPEDGYWADNVAMGARRVADGNPRLAHPKAAESVTGWVGDRARDGIGFAMSGRSVKMSDNYATGCMLGFTWNHRYETGELSPRIDMLRELMSFQRLNLFFDGFVNTLQTTHVPIDNNIRNTAVGCYSWGGVVKAIGSQGHDVWTRFTEPRGWGVYLGIVQNYVGSYLHSDMIMTASHLRPAPVHPDYPNAYRYSSGKGSVGIQGTRVEAISVTNAFCEGFDHGIYMQGGGLPHARNSMFSKDRPRFMIFGTGGLSENEAPYTFETQDLGGAPQLPLTEGVSVVTAAVPAKADVVMTGPFIIADFNVVTRAFSNVGTVQKASSLHNVPEVAAIGPSSPFPYDDPSLVWDYKGWPSTGDGVDVRNLLTREGYSTLNGDNLLILNGMPHADEVYGHFSVDMRAFRLIGDVTPYTNNGPIVLTTTQPTRADVVDTVVTGQPLVIDVLTSATATNGAAQIDTTSYRQPEHGVVTLDPVAGTATYISNTGYAGPEHFALTVKDGGNGSVTFDVDLTVTAA